MSGLNWTLWTVAALLLFWGIGAYNRLMRLRNGINAAFVQLDEHLSARAALCSKLLVLLEPLLSNEKATFDALEQAEAEVRASAQATRPRPYVAEPVGALGVASAVHAAALTRLMSMLEHHAELREHADLYALVDELKMVERRRTFSRQLFNQAVWLFNEAITQFPTRILASLYGFREARSL
ncbi:LemA family protein [Roseateles oligotrophus]|uniref:LemA family protein n=1 Tax=Roseateles oligotrophus TaxID=1769250 RepID=A0ABT2YLT8_9BURK|nr:LemA family protein [Roseateles oligotrophus]MCV2371016.1 LemA family protein [Roseateles oligotrophus]